MSEKVITKHQQDAVALGRNTVPVPECGIHATTIKGQSCKALDVPILGCTGVWLRVQKEAEAWIAPGGKLIEDNLARNRRINQAYAQLWKEERSFHAGRIACQPIFLGNRFPHRRGGRNPADAFLRMPHAFLFSGDMVSERQTSKTLRQGPAHEIRQPSGRSV